MPGGGATPGGVALCSAGLLLLVLTAIGDVVPLRGAAAPLVLAGTASLALSASLVIAQMRMLRSRLITSAARSWLDIAGGAVLALGVTWALGAPLLERSTGIGGGWATIVLVPTGAAQIATTFSLTATLLLRPHDPRMRTLTAGAAMLFAAEVAGLAASAGYGPGSDAAAVLRVGVAAALTIAVLLRDPAAGETALESTSDVVIAPVVLTTTSIGMIAWHLVEPLTSAAAWAALLTMVLVTAKTVVVFRQLDALNHIRAQAMTDALTGLGNRRALQEALAGVEGGAVVGLVVIDLDRFKAVNDTLGHAAGDELLVELARRLRESAGSDEVVVRLGGDEFALVVPGADRATARRRAAAAVTVLSRPVRLGHSTASVGASAGVAVAPLHATSAVVLQERADEAMYRAKGLDGTVVVAGDDDAPAPDRRSGPRRAEDRAVGSESIAD
ncbi:diguanylate cyclase (GGDEF) domain-containing protein [Quadrisphaera granulorum]|uniref:Diguanylate cyclase (GGDEF)-like protein n=1 Tax=Quadrisphaera granulorum TaxID=317664 RepID=A0A316AG22_9ACTN|nr:GGDEF domain-containing protein [Quadrisphaera granulorum]PWJ55864.1 diguanylate cyclase (GGDEF)-like protein [Quadrisphaera granulorum]SZE95361.1 diguanylate cyclase (GGDEF) domain-containing protein [Quadrisphaera granulorum]